MSVPSAQARTLLPTRAAAPSVARGAAPARRSDPRLYQIAVLAGLLGYGLLRLDLEVTPAQALVTLGAALGTQYLGGRLTGLPRFDPLSALISGLSLCLLLRTGSLGLAATTAVVAIASKFLIRVRGKHVFNPTNVALVAMLLVTGRVWVSPGQWGSFAIFSFLLACLGGLVVNRAARSDVTLAFLVAYAALVVGRSVWLGEPLAIPLHRLENGALVLFAFFMVSDPRTTPDSRAGRLLFGVLVAAGAWWVQFRLFRTNGLLWSLAVCSLVVPLIDRLCPGPRYTWVSRMEAGQERGSRMIARALLALGPVLALSLLLAQPALAFCGFYVAKADARLFNKASQVVLVRNEDKTVLTMSSDFRGDPQEFAVVIPVPTVLERGQINVADRAVVERIDAYTSPRLVEYFDENPCRPKVFRTPSASGRAGGVDLSAAQGAKSLGVTIEAQYTVGEYDILILSARESAGLETWLRDSGYRIPDGAGAVLGSYIRQNMRFFVARVNLKEQAKLGFSYLRPIQVAYESPKFMLPIRLGTVNADGPQELFVYALTRKGRVETTNYRTVRLPTGMEVPGFVKEEFPRFYRALFGEAVRKEDMRAVFLEYAWDMGWCDPCAADPLSVEELRKLGVFWLEERGPAVLPGPMPRGGRGGVDAFVTRLHVRYDGERFPEDLVFQETADRANFQGRYVLRHAWTGSETCEAAVAYRQDLERRREREAQTLARLTGWPIEEIRARIPGATAPAPPAPAPPPKRWWERLFGN